MSCSCRAGPLRTFISGLAQVHRLEVSSPSLRLPGPRPAAPWPSSFAATTQHSRGLHGSKLLQNDAASSSAAPEVQPGGKDEEESHGTPRAPAGRAKPTMKKPPSRPRGRPKKTPDAEGENTKKPPSFNRTEREAVDRGNKVKKERPLHRDEPEAPASSRTRTTDRSQGRSGGDAPAAKPKEGWRVQKEALKEKFPGGWNPRKRLSPDALAGIRALNAQFPDIYTTRTLSEKFEVSPENIRRILKSKWQPSPEEEEERQQRWHRRGRSVWERKAALGVKPPRKWREEGVARDPGHHARRQHAARREQELEEEERGRYRAHRARVIRSAGKGV